ncbi:Uncharacterised protein [Bordetella pertussis]|nr:Uncharacterised protein [Bordetella pertussis]CFO78071.1 Uncharacterised protein [Bordetella pertussis]CFU87489.1 Uncharacterised protein [Bordetella pertussis]CPI42630.1 Uncharacterised protein [Bordetella pertussis]CPL10140.1 Uncharacterised protein [Bordetella pertussis]
MAISAARTISVQCFDDIRMAYTRSVDLCPNSPCGMKNSTARMVRKAAASLYCDDR